MRFSGLTSGVLRGLGSALSRTSQGSKLTILIYHRVLEQPDSLLADEPDRDLFAIQMEALASHFRVLPLDEAVQRLAAGELEPRSACVTFDDGYEDNYTIALPVLRDAGLSATFFVATGFIDGGRMWNDSVIEAVRRFDSGRVDLERFGLGELTLTDVQSRRDALEALLTKTKYLPPAERATIATDIAALAGVPADWSPMMTSEQVAGLSRAGMTIGAHTVSHPLLSTLDDEAARAEVERSKADLESIIGGEVSLFAYPNGKPGKDYSRRDVEMLPTLGFGGAVSTAWGCARPATDPLQLPRFTPWDRDPRAFVLRLFHNYTRGTPQQV